MADTAGDRGVRRGDVMNVEARRNLQALEAIAEDDHLTQRTLASRLGIALGLTNIYLKRLVRKGYVKCVNVQSNRLQYLLTPKGITEKTRLTYEFMQYSLHLYGVTRRHLRGVLRPLVSSGRDRIAIYGTGEAAELAYLSLRELASEPVGIFSENGETRFIGIAVRDVHDLATVGCDRVIVATLGNPEPMIETLLDCGITRDKMICLSPESSASRGRQRREPATPDKAARR